MSFVCKSLITQNDHGDPSFLHAKEHVFGWLICGDFCLILQSAKYTVLATVYLEEHLGSFKLNSGGARHNVHGPQVFC